jgi:hypothetical protein
MPGHTGAHSDNRQNRAVTILRQGLFMAIAAAVALAVVFLVAVIADANAMVWLTGWFAHGNFVMPWGALTILLYIPLL